MRNREKETIQLGHEQRCPSAWRSGYVRDARKTVGILVLRLSESLKRRDVGAGLDVEHFDVLLPSAATNKW